MGALLWTLLAAAFVIVVVFAVIFLNKNKTKSLKTSDGSLPLVCSIWDRWLMLSEDLTFDGENKFGNAWNGSVCPSKHLFQSFNRVNGACVRPKDKEESTKQLCKQFISNDEVAFAAPAIYEPNDLAASTDHWVFLNESLKIEHNNKQGDAWNVNICPSGAALQMLEKEIWCERPENIGHKSY